MFVTIPMMIDGGGGGWGVECEWWLLRCISFYHRRWIKRRVSRKAKESDNEWRVGSDYHDVAVVEWYDGCQLLLIVEWWLWPSAAEASWWCIIRLQVSSAKRWMRQELSSWILVALQEVCFWILSSADLKWISCCFKLSNFASSTAGRTKLWISLVASIMIMVLIDRDWKELSNGCQIVFWSNLISDVQFGLQSRIWSCRRFCSPLFNRDDLWKVDSRPPYPAKSIELDESFPKRHSKSSLAG